MRQVSAALLICFLTAVVAGAQGTPIVKHTNPQTLSKLSGYTHVVEVTGGRTLYVAGQVALNQAGAVVGSGDLKAQTQQVFENLTLALAGAGATLDNVVKITVFMTDASQIQTFRDVRDRYFTGPPPASTLVQVDRLATLTCFVMGARSSVG
jgi:enamine deaminase RidA (YjgF/YER057c/UK114 family)